MSVTQKIGLILIGIGVIKFLMDRGILKKIINNPTVTAVTSLTPNIKSNKLDSLKLFIKQLDPKKDQAKIKLLVKEFGEDFLKEYLNNE